MKFITCPLVHSLLLVASHAETVNMDPFKIVWYELPHLPYGVSDMSATMIGGRSYIVGGCVGDQIRAPWDPSFFYCTKLTDKCLVFDAKTELVTPCANAPRQRYRHTASVINGMVWVVGGRDEQDQTILDIDVYDPRTDTWSTPCNWSGATSDLASFNDGTDKGTDMFLVGGYTSDYNATANLWLVDTVKTLSNKFLHISDLSPMAQARGDVAATMLGQQAFIAGGWHHSDWCNPLTSTERYDIPTKKWLTLAPLSFGRADFAMLSLNGRVFAVGGENNDECKVVSGNSVPVDIVEVYDTAMSRWELDTKIPAKRFRFTGVSIAETRSIYLFGGQHYYNSTCDCYGIAAGVVKYQEVLVSGRATLTTPSGWVVLLAATFALFL